MRNLTSADLVHRARRASSRAWSWIGGNAPLLRDDLHKAHENKDYDHIAHKAAFEIHVIAELARPSPIGPASGLQIYTGAMIDNYLELAFRSPSSIRTFGLLVYLYAKQNIPRKDLALIVLFLTSAADGRGEPSIMRKMDLACTVRLITGDIISIGERRAAIHFLIETISPDCLTADYLYSFTHIAFYLCDLATKGLPVDDSVILDRVRRNIEQYAEYTIKVGDHDLLAELIICAEMFRLPTGKIGSWISALISAQNTDGSFDRFPGKKSAESAPQSFYSRYHPTIVAIWAITMWRPIRGKGWRELVAPSLLGVRQTLELELRDMTRQLVILHRSQLNCDLPLLLDVLAARHLGTRKQIPAAIDKRGCPTPADLITLIDVLSSYNVELKSLVFWKPIENACRLVLRSRTAADVLRFASADILNRQMRRAGGDDRRAQFYDALLDRDLERVRSEAAFLRRTAHFKDIVPALRSFLIVLLIMLRRLLQQGDKAELEGLVRSLYYASTLNEFLRTPRMRART